MNNKKIIIIALLIMSVGFAAVTANLYINGTSTISAKDKDFKVYYSDAFVNGVKDLSVIQNDTTISFSETFDSIGDMYVLDYEVFNASKQYDSDLEMVCTGGNEYLSINNIFDDDTTLLAQNKRTGRLSIEMIKSYTGDTVDFEIKCTISANPVERNTIAEELDEPITAKWVYTDYDNSGDISTGDIYALYNNQNEKFWVIEQDDETVSMLALYGLDAKNRQNIEINEYHRFASNTNYEFEPGTHNIDIQLYGDEVKTVVNEYTDYIKEQTNDSTIKGDLITYNQLVNLGCTFNKGENYDVDNTCLNSPYSNLLWGTTPWWVRTEIADKPGELWVVAKQLAIFKATAGYTETVRPILKIDKDILSKTFIDSNEPSNFCRNISDEYNYGTYHDINTFGTNFSSKPKYDCFYGFDDICVNVYDKDGNYLDYVCYYEKIFPF